MSSVSSSAYTRNVPKKHLDTIMSEILIGEEELLVAVSGRVKEQSTKTKGRFGFFDLDSDKGGSVLTNYIIVTSTRVILWARGVLNSSIDSFDYADISSVEQQKGIIFGALVLNIHGKKENFAEMNKEDAENIRIIIERKIRESRTQMHSAANIVNQVQIDPLDQLEKLGSLLEKGLITRDEFEKQKTILLGKL